MDSKYSKLNQEFHYYRACPDVTYAQKWATEGAAEEGERSLIEMVSRACPAHIGSRLQKINKIVLTQAQKGNPRASSAVSGG